MSSEVEQRVVQMQFDNAQFEAGVKETLQSLQTLNKQVENVADTNTSAHGLAKIFDKLGEKAVDTEENIQKITNAFSPLGVVGRTVIENLTNKCANFAIQAGKVLTGINSMTDGFARFGQKNQAVSSLMNATGASMEDINKTLEDLNWFSDETSYDFTDMVDSMSKFAGSGQKDLKQLTRTVEGIALWGAKAGANAQTVSRAMYQLTQAVGRGYVTYEDWRDATKTTNMGTSEIKEKLIEAGGAAAIAAGAQTDFNSSLKDGWLTLDVFNEVMNQYTEGIEQANYENGEFINSQNGVTGATTKFSEEAFRNAQECKTWGDVVSAVADAVATSWMHTFEYIFGDYEESKAFFTGIGNLATQIAGDVAEVRNSIFSDWKDNGGRTALIKTMVNLINALYRVLKPVGQAFAEVFGEINGKNLAGATKSIASFTEGLKLSHTQMMKLKAIFVEVFTVIKTVISVVKPFIKYILLVSSLMTVLRSVQTILSGGLGLGVVLTLIRGIIVLGVTGKLTGFNKVLNIVCSVLKILIGLLVLAAVKVKDFIVSISKSSAFNTFIKGVNTVKNAIVNLVKIIVANAPKILTAIKNSKVVSFIIEKVKSLGSLLGEFFGWIVEKLSGLGSTISTFFNGMDAASKPLTTVVETVKDFTKTTEGTSKAVKEVGKSLETCQDNATATTKALGDTAEKVTTYEYTLEKAYAAPTAAIKEQSSAIKEQGNIFTTFLSKIKSVVEYFKGGVDWDTVIPVVAILAYCFMIKKLGDAFKSVGSAIDSFHKSVSSIADTFKGLLDTTKSTVSSIGSYFKALQKNEQFKWFYQVAIGIGVLTAALIALSFVPFDKIKTGAVCLGVITVAVIGLAGALTAISNKVDPARIMALAGAIVAITASLVVLGAELGIIAAIVNIIINVCTDAETGAINWVQLLLRLVTPIVAMSALIISLATGIKILTSNLVVVGPQFLKAAAGVLALAGSLAAFGASLMVIAIGIGSIVAVVAIVIAIVIQLGKSLNEAGKDSDKWNDAMCALLVGILGFIGTAGLIIGVIKLLNSVTREMALNALVLAAAFGIIAVSLTVISNLTGNLVDGVAGIGMSLSVIAVFLAVLGSDYFKAAITNLSGIAKSLLMLSASVLVLSAAVRMLSGLSFDQISTGMLGIIGMFFVLAGVIKIIDGAEIKKIAVAVLALVVALYALIPVMLLLSLAWKQFLPGAAMVVGLLFTMAGALRLISGIDVTKTVVGLVGIAAVLGVLVACFKVLEAIPMDQLTNEAYALCGSFAVLAVVMGVFMKSMQNMTLQQMASVAVSVGLLCAALLSLTAVFSVMQGLPLSSIIAFFVGFAASLVVFGVVAGALIVLIATFSAELLIATPVIYGFAAVLLSIAAVILSFGVSAALFGLGVSLIVNSIANLILAINTFIPTVQQFITFLSSMSEKKEELDGMSDTLGTLMVAMLKAAVGLLALGAASIVFAAGGNLAALAMMSFSVAALALSVALSGLTTNLGSFLTILVNFSGQIGNVLKMAGALAVVGVALIPFAAGAALAGVALPILAAGIAAVSLALKLLVSVFERALDAIIRFKAALALIDSALAGTADSAKSCGDNMIQGFINGLKDGVTKLYSTVKSIGEGIISKFKEVLGIHSPSKLTEQLGKYLDLGMIEGIDGNSSGIMSAVKGIGSDLGGLDGLFGDIGSSLGDTFVGSLGSSISNGLSTFHIGGQSISELLGMSSSGWSEDSVFGRQEKRNQKKQHIIDVNTKNAQNNEYYNSHKTASSDDLVSEDDFTAKVNESTEALDSNTSALDSNSDALDSNSGSSSSAADSQSDLADALDKVADNAKEALDFFSSFDKSLSSVITPKEMIANFESQSSGITSFYTNLGALAGKGYSQEFIQSLMEEGTSAYPKVASMLKATAEEAAEIQKAWDSKATIAANAKLLASTALTTAATIANLKKEDNARKASLKTVNECLTKYKKSIEDAQNANLDLEDVLLEVRDASVDTGEAMEDAGPKEELISSYQDLQKAMLEAGLSNEQLQEAMTNDNGFEAAKSEVLTIMERIADTQAIISQFQDIGSGIFDNVKSQISSSISYFDEWSSKYELTGDKLMSNVQSQIEGIAKYTENIQTIISNGGGEIVQLFGDKITPEIANAMAQLGAEQMSVLQTNLTTLSNAPVASATTAQASWLQYGKIGGTGYQEALTQLANDQSLLAQTQQIGTNVGQGLVNGMSEAVSSVESKGNELGQSAVDGTAEGAGTHSPSVKTHEIGYNVDQGLMDGIDEQMFTTKSKGVQLGEIVIAGIILGISTLRPTLMSCVRMTCEMTRQTFADGLAKPYFNEIGYNICAGLVEGIESGRSEVISAAASTAADAYAAACEELDINSPSREMAWVGQMFDAGFARGITDGSDDVNSAITAAMIQALGTAADMIESDDMSPTITPVVDLSDVQNGSRLIGTMFDNGYGFNVRTNIGEITTPTDRMSAALQGINSGSATFGDTNINIYASAGMDENALAEKVIKRINVEYARRKAAWT